MTEYGLKISKPGKDVDTAAPDELSVDSNIPIPKVIMASSRTVAVEPFFMDTIVIEHGFNLYPIFRVYGQKDPADPQIFSYPVSIGSANVTAICHSDRNNLYIGIACGGATTVGNIEIYFFIYA